MPDKGNFFWCPRRQNGTTQATTFLTQINDMIGNFNHIKIRQPNLEDLFLDLTGHSLRA